MVTFLPFKGYRPRLAAGETTADRISPPSETIDEGRLTEFKSHPGNVTNLTRSPGQDKRFTDARKLLDEMISCGGVLQDGPSFYLYEQCMAIGETEIRRRGIVGAMRAEEYGKGKVFPLDDAVSRSKNERLALLRDLETDTESVLGLTADLGEELCKRIDGSCRLCGRHVDEDGVEHRFSRIDDETVCKEISEKMEAQEVFIAGGHASYEAALAYAKESPENESRQLVMCTITSLDDPGLIVLPTHKLITAEDIGETSAIKKIDKKVTMIEVTAEEFESRLEEHLFGMMFKSGRCFVIDNKTESENPMFQLDTFSAQENVLKGVYKSDEGKSKLHHTYNLGEVLGSMTEKRYDAAVVFNAPSIERLCDIARSGKKVPKRTLSLWPEFWSGWVFLKKE
ncbi:MAG: DUF1015 domain-containing protein [archaeon]|nr:DUF1015 domain-containing protein [archaeon]